MRLRAVVPLLLCLSLFAGYSQSLSTSKLSAHLINNYTVGSSNIVSGHPRLLKVLGLDSGFPSGMVAAMRDFKARVPGGKLVVRIYSARTWSLADDATASAVDFWTNVLQAGLSHLAPSDQALIDYLEGPNEGQTPTLGYPNATTSQALQASQWFNQFWTNLTPLILSAGFKPCIGSIAVGNPGGTTAQMQSYLAAFVPALRQAKAAGGAWSYHAYTINYTTDPGTEIWYSLRYRQFYSYFASAYPDLVSMPLILSEGGVDQSGDPTTSGWQARGPASYYQRWLNWFDQQMQQDTYLLGCTLFENGDPTGWPSFELEPLAGWFEQYLLGPTNLPSPPSSLVAAAGNGSVTLTWTNVPVTPTAWSVKRGTNSAGPFFTLATNLTQGVPATTFVDNAVANGATYYYVVAAVNALGEGDPSAPIAATPLAPAYAAFNSGAGAVGPFQADAWFNAGTAYSVANSISTNGLVNPAPIPVYQSQRYGNLSYTFSFLTPNASYHVRLHFAEIYWTTIGQRVFNVFINGVQVLTNFDIIAATGAEFRANIQEFNAIADRTGTVTVQLVTVVDNASINGIEVSLNPTNSIPGTPTNLRAAVGPSLVTLTWAIPAGATGFNVRRATSAAGPYSLLAGNLTQALYRDPTCVPGTTYYYTVSASNSLGESSPSSPVSAQVVSSLPDLIVTGVTWAPANLYNGSHAVFSAQVLNQGSAPTPAGVVLGVGFNVDGAGTVSWSATYTNSLPPNGSVALSADGGPSGVNYWLATPGLHTVVATVDDVNRISESIENNNALSAALPVFAGGYALNSGGPAVGSFAADNYVAGSANTFSVTNDIDTSGASNPAPAAVYQTERWGQFTYFLSNLTPGSNYTVRLHLAELSSSVTAPGGRRFNVSVNGVQALTDFDIFATAGAQFRALTVDISKRADSSGLLQVAFTRGSVNQPQCNGLEVFGSAPASRPPLFTAFAVSNNLASFTWQTSPAAIYQVQYSNSLSPANWINLGNALVATASSLSATDNLSGTGQRFYRIVQVQ